MIQSDLWDMFFEPQVTRTIEKLVYSQFKNCSTIDNVTNFFLWMRSGSITENVFKSRRKGQLYISDERLPFWCLISRFPTSQKQPRHRYSAINISAIGPSVELLKSDSQSCSLFIDIKALPEKTKINFLKSNREFNLH